MPMIIELPIAMLACARIGVAHSVIFGGFSPDAIIDRCEDAEAKMIITADGGYRRGEPSALKINVDIALENGAQTVETVIVVNRCNLNVNMNSERDFWWHDVMKDAIPICHPNRCLRNNSSTSYTHQAPLLSPKGLCTPPLAI